MDFITVIVLKCFYSWPKSELYSAGHEREGDDLCVRCHLSLFVQACNSLNILLFAALITLIVKLMHKFKLF